ncbi:MAG: BamA/TamA family outer membrane protein, partial [Deltaproteobacteria bacterium]|nr:BamA/TamA family outer membrane protein [Deltaproteobacteria bacterium]
IRRKEMGEIAAVEVRGLPPEVERSVLASLDLASQPRQPQGLDGLGVQLIGWLPRPLQFWLDLDTVGRAVEIEIENDRLAIERAVVARGYPEAEVSARLARRDRGELVLRFEVTTGQQFQLKDILCSGNSALSCDEIRGVMVQRVGGPFTIEALDVERGRVLSLYAERGFPYADAQIQSDFDDGGRPVLRVVVNEGQHARLGAVIVDGLVRTNRAVIERELALRLDTPLEPRAVDEGVRRLRRTGLFSRVNRDYLGVEQQEERLGVRVNVEERNSLTLDSSLNFSTSELLGFESELRERNLFGLMVDARVDGRFGLFIGRRTYLRGSLGWPRIWGAPLTLSLAASYDLAERPTSARPFLDNLRLDADVKRTQALLSKLVLDVAVSEAIAVSGRYEFALDYYKYIARVTGSDLFDFDRPVRTGSVAAFVNYREIDNPFDPRHGLQISLGAKHGARYLGGESNFIVPSGSVQVYRSIDRVTIAASLRGAYGILLDTDLGIAAKRYIPERDLILAGGERSVRGHRYPSIGVRGVVVNADGETEEVINPGLLGTVVNLELRTTVVRSLWIGDLQWALFADGAHVSDLPVDTADPVLSLVNALAGREIGCGVGTGLRYVTPVGPITLDWAVDPLHLPAFEVHAQFGYTF